MRFKLIRWLAAWLCPCYLLRWINAERCYVEVHNDASGQWTVRIGSEPIFHHGTTIRSALAHGIDYIDSDPEWMWTSEFLQLSPGEMTASGGSVHPTHSRAQWVAREIS